MTTAAIFLPLLALQLSFTLLNATTHSHHPTNQSHVHRIHGIPACIEYLIPQNFHNPKTSIMDDKYIFPVQFVVGFSSNLLFIIVLRRQNCCRRGSSGSSPVSGSKTHYILTGMAFADLMFFTILFPIRFRYLKVIQNSFEYFKFWIHLHIPCMALTNAFSATSIWLTVALTVERFLVVRFPLQAKSMLRKRCIIAVIIVLFTTAFFANSHLLIGLKVFKIPLCSDIKNRSRGEVDEDLKSKPEPEPSYGVEPTTVHPMIDLVPADDLFQDFDSTDSIDDAEFIHEISNVIDRASGQITSTNYKHVRKRHSAKIEILEQGLPVTGRWRRHLVQSGPGTNFSETGNESSSMAMRTLHPPIRYSYRIHYRHYAYLPKNIPLRTLFKAFLSFNVFAVIIVPMIVIVIINVSLIQSLNRHLRTSAALITSTQSTACYEQKVTIMVIAMVTTFILFNGPSAVIHCLDIASCFQTPKPWRLALAIDVSNILVTTGKTVNFFLFSCASQTFRRHLRTSVSRNWRVNQLQWAQMNYYVANLHGPRRKRSHQNRPTPRSDENSTERESLSASRKMSHRFQALIRKTASSRYLLDQIRQNRLSSRGPAGANGNHAVNSQHGRSLLPRPLRNRKFPFTKSGTRKRGCRWHKRHRPTNPEPQGPKSLSSSKTPVEVHVRVANVPSSMTSSQPPFPDTIVSIQHNNGDSFRRISVELTDNLPTERLVSPSDSCCSFQETPYVQSPGSEYYCHSTRV